MFKQKLPQQEQGFTLIEVLVAILITTLFVSVAMQAIVIAAVFKARARQYTEATTWIQEDLEAVKYQAVQLTYDPTKCAAGSSTTGFGKYLEQNLPVLSSTKTIAGKTYTLTRDPVVGGTAAVSGTCTANACYDLLQLTYKVRSGTEPLVATLYTEVIPDAVFQCSQ